MRILAVDDDPLVLQLIEDICEGECGWSVACATTAERARKRLHGKPSSFDVVLLDTPMLDHEGVELARELRHKGERVLMIAAGEDRVPICVAEDLPYLVKPFTPDELIEAIERLCPPGKPTSCRR